MGTGILIDLLLIEINHGTGLIFTSSIDNMRKICRLSFAHLFLGVVQLHNYDEIWVLVKVNLGRKRGAVYPF